MRAFMRMRIMIVMTTRTELAHAEACCFDCGCLSPCRCQSAPSGCEYCGSRSVRSGTCARCAARFAAALECPCGSGAPVVDIQAGCPVCDECLVYPAPVTSTRPGPLSATA